MSVNRYHPHVLVLPEDDANRQLANGFHLQIDPARQRQMQVLPIAGGWNQVPECFNFDHVKEMRRCPARFMVLLIDFDGNQNRLETARAAIPADLTARVFVLGALSEPEELKADLGAYETIGSGIGKDCREKTGRILGHRLLHHNTPELDRLREQVFPILFPPD